MYWRLYIHQGLSAACNHPHSLSSHFSYWDHTAPFLSPLASFSLFPYLPHLATSHDLWILIYSSLNPPNSYLNPRNHVNSVCHFHIILSPCHGQGHKVIRRSSARHCPKAKTGHSCVILNTLPRLILQYLKIVQDMISQCYTNGDH